MADSFNLQDFIRKLNEVGAAGADSGNGGGAGGASGGNSAGSGGAGSGGNKGASGGGKASQWTVSPADRLEKMRKILKRFLIVILIAIIPVLLGCYWWFHPPINIHSFDCWMFVIILILLPTWLVLRFRSQFHSRTNTSKPTNTGRATLLRRLSWLPVAVVVACVIGGLASASFFPGNAERYATILKTEASDFAADIKEADYNEIPVIDRSSATLLGNRVMGAIPEYVSQFEISPLYSQINYKGHPVRVSPLVYADFFKWFNNRDSGLPAYVLVDMTTQDTEIVRLNKPMYFSESEPFERNIARHVQLSFPFYMFDQISFEIDEEGNPWWVCPVQTRTIGLFGGTTIERVILVDANSGECTDLPVADTPQWVDRVYPAELLIEQYNWSGALSSGWINSWLGQSGVVQTTPGTAGQVGYNYLAKDDDVWVYTGVTSATADNSIVGFVLVNQRTAESHYYAIAGATEVSAMSSAQGQVQHLSYVATFPLLLNINNQPTYFMALKDGAGLVKMYAMLDIQRYQNVAVGDTVAQCQAVYQELLVTNGVEVPAANLPQTSKVTGTVARIATAVIEGNSHFYLTLENDGRIFDCALPALLDVLAVNPGDNVALTFVAGEQLCKVEALEVVSAAVGSFGALTGEGSGNSGDQSAGGVAAGGGAGSGDTSAGGGAAGSGAATASGSDGDVGASASTSASAAGTV